MKKLFPFLLLLFAVCLFFQPVILKELLPIPSDSLVGLYHPFRDLYAATNPRGIPYKNFLITDPVLQQIPWRSLAISLEKQMQLPLWNPYSFSGMPLLANLQSAAFYPLNLLFFVLPFSAAWTILVLLQPIFASIFMYLLLRNYKLPRLSSVFGGLVFAFSGFSLVWLEWGTVVQTGLWLPLILLATDKLFETQKKKLVLWSSIFVGSVSFSLFAGHLQTFFYVLLVASFYILARMIQKKSYSKLVLFTVLFFVVSLITLPQWFPLFKLIQLSGRNIDHISYKTLGWFIPLQNLAQFIAPDFFGNPATLNYWGVWNYMEFIGYVGLFPLLFALLALFFVRAKKVYFFGSLVLGSLIFAVQNPIAVLPFVLHIPFIETSQPTRLLFVIDFGLSILAAIGLSSVKKISKNTWSVFMLLFVLLVTLWLSVAFHAKIGLMAGNALVAKQNLIFPSLIICTIFIVFIISWFTMKTRKGYVVLPLLVLIITCVDLFRFGYKFTPFTSVSYLFPQTKVLTFLKENAGNYRIMETTREILSPNASVMYGLQSIDGYDPLYIQRYGEFIAASERGKADINAPFGFNRIITPHNYSSQLMNLLGVKYILSLQNLEDKNLKKVFEDGETKVYENTKTLPRVFFVKNIITVNTKQDAIDKLFSVQTNLVNTAVVENTTNDKNFMTGSAVINTYQPNNVVIKTENNGKGFLVLTDVYYPTWHVFIDGKESKLLLTDFTLRGVEVPSGNHTVIFKDSLF